MSQGICETRIGELPLLGEYQGRESRKEISGRVERDRSIMRYSKFHIQPKAHDKFGLAMNESQMVKQLRSYDPHNKVVLEVWQEPCPLTIPRSQLIAHLKGKKYVRWPSKIHSNPAFVESSKFCKFHNDHGHYTIDCRQLKVGIAQLLWQKHLKEFLLE